MRSNENEKRSTRLVRIDRDAASGNICTAVSDNEAFAKNGLAAFIARLNEVQRLV